MFASSSGHTLRKRLISCTRQFLRSIFFLTLAFPPFIGHSQPTQTAWYATAVDSLWRNTLNWNAGVPSATLNALISNTNYAPHVPVPASGDTARTRDLQLQNGGELFFDSAAVLIVHGTQLSQNGGSIYLSNGTLLFTDNVRFLNGGTFDAGSGTLQFQGVTWESKSGSSFIPGTSTVIFAGADSQTVLIDTSINLQFYDLQILTQGTVTITGDVTVQNDCYVAAGCTLNVPVGSSFTVNGEFTGEGVITGGGTLIGLPVQLSSFVATAAGLSASLHWRTETEVNNYGFEIERRKVQGSILQVQGPQTLNFEPGSWNLIGFVRGSGTSSSPHEYLFSDDNLSPGRYAYRLKQIDLDGSSSYFDAAEIEIGLAPMSLSLGQNYPNPFNPATTMEFTLPEAGHAILKVYNVIGQEVATLFDREAEAGRVYQATFNATSLPSGLYFARLNFEGQTLLRRMTLVK